MKAALGHEADECGPSFMEHSSEAAGKSAWSAWDRPERPQIRTGPVDHNTAVQELVYGVEYPDGSRVPEYQLPRRRCVFHPLTRGRVFDGAESPRSIEVDHTGFYKSFEQSAGQPSWRVEDAAIENRPLIRTAPWNDGQSAGLPSRLPSGSPITGGRDGSCERRLRKPPTGGMEHRPSVTSTCRQVITCQDAGASEVLPETPRSGRRHYVGLFIQESRLPEAYVWPEGSFEDLGAAKGASPSRVQHQAPAGKSMQEIAMQSGRPTVLTPRGGKHPVYGESTVGELFARYGT